MSPRVIPLSQEAGAELASMLADASPEIRGLVAEELRRLARAFRQHREMALRGHPMTTDATTPPAPDVEVDDVERVARAIVEACSGPWDMFSEDGQEAARHEARAAIAALSSPPAGGLREAVEGIADDYMTSERHHPGYVLIPTAKFEAICKALASAEAPRETSAPLPALEWAVDRWNAEVKNRPLVNIHRRSLDDTWRQVMRYFGGDPDALVGPSHDDLVAEAPAPRIPIHAPCEASAWREPDGWKLVPITPTDDMLAFGDEAMVDTKDTENWLNHCRNAYAAMVFNAPDFEPPALASAEAPRETSGWREFAIVSRLTAAGDHLVGHIAYSAEAAADVRHWEKEKEAAIRALTPPAPAAHQPGGE